MHQIKTGYSIPCIHVAGSQTQQGDVDAAISTEFTPGPYVTEQFYALDFISQQNRLGTSRLFDPIWTPHFSVEREQLGGHRECGLCLHIPGDEAGLFRIRIRK